MTNMYNRTVMPEATLTKNAEDTAQGKEINIEAIADDIKMSFESFRNTGLSSTLLMAGLYLHWEKGSHEIFFGFDGVFAILLIVYGIIMLFANFGWTAYMSMKDKKLSRIRKGIRLLAITNYIVIVISAYAILRHLIS